MVLGEPGLLQMIQNQLLVRLGELFKTSTERGGLSGAIFLRLSARELRAAPRAQILGHDPKIK